MDASALPPLPKGYALEGQPQSKAANYFDQFDPPAKNYFDQFDAPTERGPWEQYQQHGPWTKYQTAKPGMFDDLIPNNGANQQGAKPGMFDDLIPGGGNSTPARTTTINIEGRPVRPFRSGLWVADDYRRPSRLSRRSKYRPIATASAIAPTAAMLPYWSIALLRTNTTRPIAAKYVTHTQARNRRG